MSRKFELGLWTVSRGWIREKPVLPVILLKTYDLQLRAPSTEM